MTLLPNEVKVPPLPYVQEITAEVDKLKNNPYFSSQLEGVEIPDFASMETIQIEMGGDSEVAIPEEMVAKLQASDVTTITSITKELAESMFNEMTPELVSDIQGGIQKGIEGISTGLAELEKGIDMMSQRGPAQGGMAGALEEMNKAKGEMTTLLNQMQTLHDAIPEAFEQAKADYLAEIDNQSSVIESTYQSTLNTGYQNMFLVVIAASVVALISLLFYRKKKTV